MASFNWKKQWSNANGIVYHDHIKIGSRLFSIFKTVFEGKASYNLSELKQGKKGSKILYTKEKMTFDQIKNFFAPKSKKKPVETVNKNSNDQYKLI